MDQKTKIFLYAILLIFLRIPDVRSQQINYPAEFYYNQIINQRINLSDQIIHSGFKPLLISNLSKKNVVDSLFYQDSFDKIFSEKFRSSWFYRKLRTEDFVNLHAKSFSLKVNPLFNLELKKENNDNQKYYINTRGIEFKGDIGKKLSFYSSFYENQAHFVPYITSNIKKTLVAPGQGAVKFLENDKFDFSRAEAYLSLSLNENFNFQFGHSKHFIGEGYRSLILSDNAFNYPFFKFIATYKQLQYIILWSQYQTFSGAYYNYHQRKYNALTCLSWAPAPGFEFSFIESIIWPGNTNENKNNFNLNFFNPLIFSRTIQFGLDNEKNILLGFNTRIKIYGFAQLFAQFAIDKIDKDINAQNNYAFQIGFKHFDLFHHKLPNHSLFVHSEFNYIAPYTYSWKESKQSFSHYNQPMAHPAGSGLKEIFGTIKYQYKDLSLIIKGSYIINSTDTLNSNFGSDIFKPNAVIVGITSNIGNKPGQGIKNELFYGSAELAFLINRVTNMQLFLGLNYRKNNSMLINTENIFLSFGIKTNLTNYYYDF